MLFLTLIRIEKSFNNDLKVYALSVFLSEINTIDEPQENYPYTWGQSRLIKEYDSFYMIKEISKVTENVLLVEVTVSTNEDKVLYNGQKVIDNFITNENEEAKG
jgi:hypothetical protein